MNNYGAYLLYTDVKPSPVEFFFAFHVYPIHILCIKLHSSIFWFWARNVITRK